MFCWVFLSMSVMMNLFIIIVGESFEVVKETSKFNWLTDERVITMDKSQREFDDTSSSSSDSSDDSRSDEGEGTADKDQDGDKSPAKVIDKKLRSVRALKQIIDEDYSKWAGSSINQSPPP